MGANNRFNYDNTPVQEEAWKSYYTRIFTTYNNNNHIMNSEKLAGQVNLV